MRSVFLHATAPSNVRRQDLPARSGMLEKEQTRILHALHAAFAPRLAEAMHDLLGAQSVSLVSIEETTPEACARRERPEYVTAFSALHPHAGRCEFYGGLAGIMLDALLNYRSAVPQQHRRMSEIEVQLLNSAIEPLLDAYAECWRDHARFQPQLREITEFTPGEPLYVATYAVMLPEGVSHVTLTLRLSAWTDALGSMSLPQREDTSMSYKNLGLLGAIGDTTLNARVMLGSSHISIADFLSLRVGDVICLDQDANAPVEIRVGNRAKLSGEARIQNGRYVITIEDSTPKGGE